MNYSSNGVGVIDSDGHIVTPLEIVQMLNDLAAARKVVEAARVVLNAPLFEYRAPLVHAIAEYDWATQGVKNE